MKSPPDRNSLATSVIKAGQSLIYRSSYFYGQDKRWAITYPHRQISSVNQIKCPIPPS